MSLNGKEDGKPGRPLKLTPKIHKLYCDARSIGMGHEAAAAFAGVSYHATRNWRLRGEVERERVENGEAPRPEEAVYLKFIKGVQDADGEVAALWQQTLTNAAQTTPYWAAYMLERRYPEEYAPPVQQLRTKVEANSFTANFDVAKLNNEQLARLVAGEDLMEILADAALNPAEGDGGTGTAA